MEQDRIEKYRRRNMPTGRVPQISDLVRAETNPGRDDRALVDYLAERPEYREFIRNCLDLRESAD